MTDPTDGGGCGFRRGGRGGVGVEIPVGARRPVADNLCKEVICSIQSVRFFEQGPARRLDPQKTSREPRGFGIQNILVLPSSF